MTPHKSHLIAVLAAIVCAILLLHSGANHRSPAPQVSDATMQMLDESLSDTRFDAVRASIPNFLQVSDTLYRGCQPDHKGFVALEKLGVKTVINLRSMHSDEDEIGDLPLVEIRKPLVAWDEPEEETVLEFLLIVTNPEHQPVYVHCQHGVDRTGVMCATYRMVIQGWEPEQAIAEMRNMGGHKIWRKKLETFLRELDVEDYRKELASHGRYPQEQQQPVGK